jgi:hypothetical protein
MSFDPCNWIGILAHSIRRHVRFFRRAVAQTPREDLAAQIREQGYRCGTPLNAKKDIRRSKPDQAVWILKCKAATFRIRLNPDNVGSSKEAQLTLPSGNIAKN